MFGKLLYRNSRLASVALVGCLPFASRLFFLGSCSISDSYPIVMYLLNLRMWFKNGLKAQKLLAQGDALG